MKKYFKYFLVVFLFLNYGCQRNSETITPVRKDIIQAVYASGKLLPLNDYTVISRTPGYIEKIHVRAGQFTTVGSALVDIRNEQNELSIQTAANQLELAKANAHPNGPILSGLREEMEGAVSKYRLDSISLFRTRSLFNDNACSRQQLDQAEAQAEISKKIFERTQHNLAAATERYGVELRNAGNQYEAQRTNRSDYQLLSAVSGKIYDVFPEVGDLVGISTPLMEIGDSAEFEVELSIDETDIGLIAKGQPVTYSIDAFPDTIFKGTVNEIIPHVLPSTKSSRIKATIQTQPGYAFYSGMSIEANIVVREKKNCLVIPREYLHNGNEVKVKNETTFRKIKIGIEDLQYLEVIHGIGENDQLVK